MDREIGMSSAVISMSESERPPLDEAWLTLLEDTLAKTNWDPSRTERASIFRVPSHIRDDYAKLYDPKAVSLGPYHRNVDLLPMNRLKWHFLKKFLGRCTRYALVDYLRLIKHLEGSARAAYADDLPCIASNEFVQMMLLDGCFVVETVLLMKIGFDGLEVVQNPIASSSWILHVVARDMLMLENQLPFFLLQLLFDYGGYALTLRVDFAKCAVDFFNKCTGMKLELPPDVVGKGGYCHLLHLVHSCINPIRAVPKVKERVAGEAKSRMKCCSLNESTSEGSIPSAMRLSEAGVKFKRKRTENLLDITFHNGKMEIPQLIVNDHINTLFRNLIAFEQGYKCASQHVTSYASLMDCIIDTPADVTLLQKGEIIVNWLGNNDDVAVLFNKLCYEVSIDGKNEYLASVFEEANKHYRKRCNQFLSILRRDYFGNPWSGIALIAAILIFLLTLTQTVITVLAYVRPPRN